MTEPRDYRDEADIDEFLDLIRVVPREQAKKVYRDCLDIAYRQGRVDSLEAAVRNVEEAVRNAGPGGGIAEHPWRLSMTDKTEHVPGELSMDEKRATLLNDARVREQGSTMMEHTHSDEGGRFLRPTMVTGAAPVQQVPEQPPNSPFHHDPVGQEPLIDATDCGATFGTALGEPHELKVSPLERPPPFSGARGNSPSPASEVAPPDPLAVEQRSAGLGPLPENIEDE